MVHTRLICVAVTACLLSLSGLAAAATSSSTGDDTGACCVWWMGGCIEGLSEEDCFNEEGTFHGVGVSCDEVTCSFPCCMGNGDCIPVADKFECYDLGGMPLGGDCSSVNCEDYAMGACCFGDACEIRLRFVCENQGGTFQGGDTTCESAECNVILGACCVTGNGLDWDCVDDVTHDFCETLMGNGDGGIYIFYANQHCDDIECPPAPWGACCTSDGCISTDEIECLDLGGEFEPGVDCASVECNDPDPVGACCVTGNGLDWDCVDDVTHDFCETLMGNGDGGIYIFYANQHCDDIECPPAPWGACCISGEGCMSTLDETDCLSFGGVFEYGVDCTTMACSSDTGACCFGDECVPMSLLDCEADGGIFLTYGLDCEPNPCVSPWGSCCLSDGSCVNEISETGCIELDGTWAEGGDCDSEECNMLLGACCVTPDGIDWGCNDGLTHDFCKTLMGNGEGGTYIFYANQQCDDIECPPDWNCFGDTNIDGEVDVLDLLNVIGAWDSTDPDADIDDSGIVDVLDLLIVIQEWGTCA